MDIVPLTTPVSSTCSIDSDLSLDELPEQSKVIKKQQMSRRAALKKLKPDVLESNQTKHQRTLSASAKSGKYQLRTITANNTNYSSYAVCDSKKDYPVKTQSPTKKEIPEVLNNLELKQNLHEANQHLGIVLTKDESIDILPLKTPVSSTSSFQMVNMSSAELPEQPKVITKTRRSPRVALENLNPDKFKILVKTCQTKHQRTKSARSKSGKLEKHQEVSLITIDNTKNPSLGNYDSTKDSQEKTQGPTKKRIPEEDHNNLKLKRKLDKANQNFAEVAASYESLNNLFNNSTELPKQPKVLPIEQNHRQIALKQSNSDELKLNQTKQQKTESARAESGEFQEVSLITTDNAYYTCLGNYNPIKGDLEKTQGSIKKKIPEENLNNLEAPSWRIKEYSILYAKKGTENMSDDMYENRHSKLEVSEQKRKRWDLQRMKELEGVEYLKEGHNNHPSQNSKENVKEDLTTLLPNPTNIQVIQITDNLPVSAFGCNLYAKKSPEMFTFFRSKWYNDGSGLTIDAPQVKNKK